MANLQNPVKAIRVFCVKCMDGNNAFVRNCPTETCALHPFRMGKNPYRTRKMSEEEQRAGAERLQRYRDTKKKEAQHV